ncbi:hypothetical protein [Streptomyces sp. NPDC020951]|uniref:hypothetical protein n=1 Tax=Streptomyces sp. NPDC020951 TaxID=3365104 RepID=UPI00379EA2EE
MRGVGAHSRVAPGGRAEYRRARVMFARDTAHPHLPVGGQGMNTWTRGADRGCKLGSAAHGTDPRHPPVRSPHSYGPTDTQPLGRPRLRQDPDHGPWSRGSARPRPQPTDEWNPPPLVQPAARSLSSGHARVTGHDSCL